MAVAWFTVRHPHHPSRPYRLCIDEDDGRARWSYRHGVAYEPVLLEGIRRFLSAGETFLDVGAHVGNHTSFMALVAGAHVHAFEPNPETFSYLTAGVKENGLEDVVTCHRLALGDQLASGRLVTGRSLGRTKIAADTGGDVRIVPLAEAYDGPVSVLKVDVEGAEEAVIRGALPLIETHRPVLVVETNEGGPQVADLLRALGYRRFPLSLATRTYFFVPRRRLLGRVALTPGLFRLTAGRVAGRLAREYRAILKG